MATLMCEDNVAEVPDSEEQALLKQLPLAPHGSSSILDLCARARRSGREASVDGRRASPVKISLLLTLCVAACILIWTARGPWQPTRTSPSQLGLAEEPPAQLYNGDKIYLRTYKGTFVDAIGGSEVSLQALRTSEEEVAAQELTVVTEGEGPVRSGDSIYLETRDHGLLGVGSDVADSALTSTARGAHGRSQSWVVERRGGGLVLAGGALYLKAATGKYLGLADDTHMMQANGEGWGRNQALSLLKKGLPAPAAPGAPQTSTTSVPGPQHFASVPGDIESGDTIFLKSKDGMMLDFQGDDGSLVRARFPDKGPRQSFVIEKDATGAIRSGDTVYLRTSTGRTVDVAGDSNGLVRAQFSDHGDWQALVIETEKGGVIMTGDGVRLRAHTGNYLEFAAKTMLWASSSDPLDEQNFVIERKERHQQMTTTLGLAASKDLTTTTTSEARQPQWAMSYSRWEVVYPGGCNVRQEKSTTSEILGTKLLREEVKGVLDGEWISLAHGEGYMLSGIHGLVLLQERAELFTRVADGSCAAAGRLPIAEKARCERAAEALQLAGPVRAAGRGPAPEGCYAEEGSVFFSTDLANKDRGAVGSKQPLCRTEAEAEEENLATPLPATSGPRAPAGPTAYDGHFTHPAFEYMGLEHWRSIPIHVELLTSTDGTWAALGDTKDIRFKWKGGQVQISEINAKSPTTTFAGEVDEEGAIRGSVIQDNVPGGTFTLVPAASTDAAAADAAETSTTSTSTWSKRNYPSLFCFGVVTLKGPNAYELDLVKEQMSQGVGIFGCDEFAVFAKAKVSMGETVDGVSTDTIAFSALTVHDGDLNVSGTTTDSWLNAMNFMKAWNALKDDGRYARHDWVLKADPDTVVLPDRIRTRLIAEVPGGGTGDAPIYVQNCNEYPPGAMYGSLEVVSRRAVELYFEGEVRCREELPWRGWGEDMFMEQCLLRLGTAPLKDFGMVGDRNCLGYWCGNTSVAAFHPFKSVQTWFDCWGQANPTAQSSLHYQQKQ